MLKRKVSVFKRTQTQLLIIMIIDHLPKQSEQFEDIEGYVTVNNLVHSMFDRQDELHMFVCVLHYQVHKGVTEAQEKMREAMMKAMYHSMKKQLHEVYSRVDNQTFINSSYESHGLDNLDGNRLRCYFTFTLPKTFLLEQAEQQLDMLIFRMTRTMRESSAAGKNIYL
jgi:hypothetical protein